jgi:hypothetical protein
MVQVYDEDMPKLSYPAAPDIQYHTSTLCFLVQLFIGDLVRPEDAADSSETPIMESVNLVHVAFDDLPTFRAIQQNWLD